MSGIPSLPQQESQISEMTLPLPNAATIANVLPLGTRSFGRSECELEEVRQTRPITAQCRGVLNESSKNVTKEGKHLHICGNVRRLVQVAFCNVSA
jgi:hypothetical protein